jgi:hypothetical protein
MGNRRDAARRGRQVLVATAMGAAVAIGSAVELGQAQEPSVLDKAGDFLKNLIPGQNQPQGGQQPAQQSTPPQPPPAQQPQAQAPAAQPSAAQPPTAQAPAAQPPAAAAPSGTRPSQPSITERVGDFFKRLVPGGTDEHAPPLQAGRTPKNEAEATEEFDCPVIDIREGASTLMVQGPGEPSPLSLRYQASFVRAARECIVKGKDVTIKVGVQGRVILGPAGGAGQLTIPLRYALVYEELGQTRMIWSKLYALPVTVQGQQPNVPFEHVEEEMTVPIPKASELENYIVYIGFDPNGLPQEHSKKAPPPKAKPKKPAQ